MIHNLKGLREKERKKITDLLESVQEENNIENIPGHRLTENLLPLLRLQKLSHRFLCFRQNELGKLGRGFDVHTNTLERQLKTENLGSCN